MSYCFCPVHACFYGENDCDECPQCRIEGKNSCGDDIE
jgi:hypothetical protein